MSDSNDLAVGYAMGQDSGNSRGNGWGDGCGEWIWIIVLFALFGWGGNGFGGFGGGNRGGGTPVVEGIATRADITEGFALNDIQNGIRGIQQGICDSTYSLNNNITNGFHGTDMALCNGFNGVQQSFNQLGYQMQDCCCQTQNAIQGVRYDMATQACDTRNLIQNTARDLLDNQNANTRSILDFLVQDKISSLTAENQTLKFQASQANQNSYIAATMDAQTAELIRRCCPSPVPAYTVPAPYPYAANCGGGCGCGC